MMLYHYTSEEGFLGILRSKKLWLVSSMEMSDISDRFYGNLFATTALLTSDHHDAVLLRSKLSQQEILDINMKTFQTAFYSASFCDQPDNPYLWENYASKRSGYAISFDDDYFREQLDRIVSETYSSTGDEDTPNKEIIVENRQVQYGSPNEFFLKVLSSTKNCCIGPEDIENSVNHTNAHFRNWLELTLVVLAGIIKAEAFKEEKEIRFLFQNRCSDQYVRLYPYYAVVQYRLAQTLKSLGLTKEIKDEKKKRMELDLSSFFNSTLIPAVVVGLDNTQAVLDIRKHLNKAGLTGTKIIDIQGKDLEEGFL